jgi:hypothetical protein
MHRPALACTLLVALSVAKPAGQSPRPGALSDADVTEIIAWARALEEPPLPYVLRYLQSDRHTPFLGGVYTPRLRIAAWVRGRLARDTEAPINPGDVPPTFREPIVIVELASMSLARAPFPPSVQDEFGCGRRTHLRLLPSDDLRQLHTGAGIPPLWFQTKRLEHEPGREPQCLVTAAFDRADIERSQLLYAALIVESQDLGSFASTVVVHVGPGESRGWR